MKDIGLKLAWLAATAWIGSQWAIGYLAVPVLFQTLPDKMLAGMLAGKMFSLVSWLGIVAGCYLLAFRARPAGKAAMQYVPWWLLALLLALTLGSEFGFQPAMASLKAQVYPADIMHTAYAGKFKMLHGIASSLYLVQSLLGAALILKMSRR